MNSNANPPVQPLPAHNNLFLCAGALALSAVLLFLGSGLHPLWWLTWFAPLPLLLLAPRISARSAFAISALAWFLGGLNMWHYLRALIEIPTILVLIFLIAPACVFAFAVLSFRSLLLRGALWQASLAFPAWWAAYEYLYSVFSPHSTFGNLGYTQMDCLPVLQLVSLTGIWGISFCLFLLPATAAALLSKLGTRAQKTKLAVLVGLFFISVLGYGAWRLHFTPAPEKSVNVGLMATGVGSPYPQDDAAALQLLRSYSDQLTILAPHGTELIVLPEKIAAVSDQATAQVDALFESTAARMHADILVGIDRGTATRRSNEARLYSSDGSLAAVYDKHHLVPRFEDVDQPGTQITVLREPSGVWGIEICKDLDFPRLSRQYGARGVALLIVPAWDFTLDGWLHGRMAIMRGVESGFTIVRAAKQGVLTVSDDRGRVLAERDAASVPFAYLFAAAPVRHVATLYTRCGNWFAWANLILLLAILVCRAKTRFSPRP
ncbi:MAG: nitrilase-related carbon-nitrogen hydrolase [Candidatus Acidiferrales bacterium]